MFAGEDEALLVGGNAFFVLNFLFYGLDGVVGFDLKVDGFVGERFDEDLHLVFVKEKTKKNKKIKKRKCNVANVGSTKIKVFSTKKGA